MSEIDELLKKEMVYKIANMDKFNYLMIMKELMK